MVESDELLLIRECLMGHPESFEALVDKYQKPIFNVALRMLNNHEDARDVTQSVFVKAFEKLDTYSPKYKFFSWIYRMVINDSINFINKRKRLDELDPKMIAPEKGPEQEYHEIELSERIQDALMQLQIDYRAVIVLRHFEDLSYREIAFVLDLPEKTVKSRLFTSRQMLKDILLTKGIAHD